MNFLERSPILHISLIIIAGCVLFGKTDILVAKLLYDEEKGGFYLKSNLIIHLIHDAIPYITAVIATIIILGCILSFTRWKEHFFLKRKQWLYLLLALALGPGLLVNLVFKDHWGRARPVQLVQFGGEKTFTRAFVISDQCQKNCSFVSGHASIGFFVAAFAYLFKRRFNVWIATGIALGSVVGAARVMEGGHFVTDVIACGLIVLLTNHGVYLLMKRLNPQHI